VNQVNPLYLFRKTLLFFMVNVIYTMAIVSFGFFSGYNPYFISHEKVVYFILFFSSLSLVLVFVFSLSIRDCARLYPFDYVIYAQTAISLGFLLTLIENPLMVNLFFLNLILLVIAFNAMLHYQREIVVSVVLPTLSLINVLYYVIVMLAMWNVVPFLIMMLCTQVFIFYLVLSFIDIMVFLNITQKNDFIFLSFFIYTATLLVAAKFMSVMFIRIFGSCTCSNGCCRCAEACGDCGKCDRCCDACMNCTGSCDCVKLCGNCSCPNVDCGCCANVCSNVDCGCCANVCSNVDCNCCVNMCSNVDCGGNGIELMKCCCCLCQILAASIH